MLRRLRPYRTEFGRRRGNCIDRFYIEKFLGVHKDSIRGAVAEFESDLYIRRFGEGVENSEILDLNEQNTCRTITLDLARPETVPADRFNCVICTQTLLLIRDCQAAVRSLYKMLRPAGVALVTVPGICPVVAGPLVAGAGEDWWRFTARSAGYVFSEVFGEQSVQVETFGNVLTTTAFLHGLVQEELTREELEFHDPSFELVIGIRATKAPAR